MDYKDRECYLGASATLGFLDKGGRWRKKDWWTKDGNDKKSRSAREAKRIKIAEEIATAKREDQALMNHKLGIKDDLGSSQCTDLSQVLAKLRHGDGGEPVA